MNNLLITMSGGTTTVINATLAGIIQSAQKSKKINKVFAGLPGISGVLNDNLIDLSNLSEDELAKLEKTPSSGVIGTTRVKKFDTSELKQFKFIIEKYNIGYFINIGGNGTIKQTKYLADAIPSLKAISLPKTVDNDLGDDNISEMYYTPGFPSVVNYWYHKVLMLNNENLGACSHDKVLIAQTFGRETGFITGAARLADPDRQLPLILLIPEDQKPLGEVLEKIRDTIDKFGRAIVIMSEGYKISSVGSVKDFSGQTMYSSSKQLAAQLLVNQCVENNMQARAFIPGVDQRSEILFTTQQDIDVSKNVGKFATTQLENDKFNFLCCIYQDIDGTVKFKAKDYISFDDYSRVMPEKFILKNKFDVSDAYIEYLKDVCEDRQHLLRDPQLNLSSFLSIG